MTFTAAQLEERRQGIGASEIGAVLGLDHYRSPLQVYADKRGLTEPDGDSEAAEWGRRLEPVIADAYLDRNPGILLVPSLTLQHPTIPWAFATPDRIGTRERVEGDESILDHWNVQIKSRNFFAASDFGQDESDEVPDTIAAQVQWEMAVADLPFTDIPVLFGGNRLRIFRVHRDAELIALMFARAEAFWTQHVVPGIAPDASGIDKDFLKRLFPRSTDVALQDGDADLYAKVVDLQSVKALMKDNEAGREALENQIKAAIGEGVGFTFPNGAKVTWKNNKDTEFTNWERVAFALADRFGVRTPEGSVYIPPEILAQCSGSKPGPRVLRVSLPKEGQ